MVMSPYVFECLIFGSDVKQRNRTSTCLFVFILFGVFRPNRERAANFDLYPWHSWHLSSEGSLECHTYCDMAIYIDHLRGPAILSPVAECLTLELSLSVFTT